MSEALVVRLAHEEAVYLLRALGIPAVGGLTADALDGLQPTESDLALAVADRTLRARGMVHWSGAEQREVDGAIAGLLRDASHPVALLTVAAQSGEAAESRLAFGFVQRLAIEYSTPEPGVHQFVTFSDRHDVQARLDELLRIDEEQEAYGRSQVISGACWRQAESTAGAGIAAVTSILERELPAEIAASLAHVLSVPLRAVSVAFQFHAPAPPTSAQPTAGFTLLIADTAAWLIIAAGGSGEQIRLVPASRHEVRREVLALASSALSLMLGLDQTTP